MSDRICVMREGRIEQIGTPQELYFRPRNIFVADFLGESNLLAGRLADVSGGYGVVELATGHRVRGIAVEPLPRGASVRVMVRPEAITPVPHAAGENAIRARPTDRVISGGTTKCFYRGDDGAELRVQVLTRQCANGGAQDGEAFLTWDSEASVILKDE